MIAGTFIDVGIAADTMLAMIAAHEITILLKRMDEGERGAADELMRMVYRDLERMAASHLRKHFGQRAGQVTLEPAALVNESFLRLIKQRKSFDNRGQFFAIATKIMLRVLIDYRREKLTAKRGGAHTRLTLSIEQQDDAARAKEVASVDVESLAAAFENLEQLDARKAEIVKMRIVWGMTVPEVAQTLDISPSSVDRDWRFAKAWIADEIGLTGRPARK